jgi:hypothetical protein
MESVYQNVPSAEILVMVPVDREIMGLLEETEKFWLTATTFQVVVLTRVVV